MAEDRGGEGGERGSWMLLNSFNEGLLLWGCAEENSINNGETTQIVCIALQRNCNPFARRAKQILRGG